MASVLLTWELGGGWGHLTRLKAIARGLLQRGHRVAVASRDLSNAPAAFGADVTLIQAPVQTRPPRTLVNVPMTLAHVLANNAFGDRHELSAFCRAWRTIFDFVKPELMICDHSPTALLAARGRAMIKCLVGTGFTCPPDLHPLPNLRPWLQADAAALLRDETAILDNVNFVLADCGQSVLGRLTQLFADVDATFLMTLPELDHYPSRTGAEYWGGKMESGGIPPSWPDGDGPRIYGYLRSFPALPELLKQLREWKYPTLIFGDRIESSVKQQFASPTLRFTEQSLDLNAVGRRCFLALLHGTHGATMSLLLAGAPILQIPIYLEQALMGQAVRSLGAGLVAPINNAAAIRDGIRQMLASDEFSASAKRFSVKYRTLDSSRRLTQILDRLDHLLAAPREAVMKISFCTPAKGRTAFLRATYSRNIQCAIDVLGTNLEFVLVNLDSPDGMDEWVLRELAPAVPRQCLAYYRAASSHPRYAIPEADNTAMRLATGTVISNMMADVILAPAYFRSLPALAGDLPGRNIVAPPARAQRGTTGLLTLHARDFQRLGGYDESMKGWGYQDVDLVRRAVALGLRRRFWTAIACSCLKHDDELRLQFSPVKHESLESTNRGNQRLSEQNVRAGSLEANLGKPWGGIPVERVDL